MIPDAREFIEKMLATRFLDDEDSYDPEKRFLFKKKTSGEFLTDHVAIFLTVLVFFDRINRRDQGKKEQGVQKVRRILREENI